MISPRPRVSRTMLTVLMLFLSVLAMTNLTEAQEKQPAEAACPPAQEQQKPEPSDVKTEEKQEEESDPAPAPEKEKRKPAPPKPAPLNGTNYIFDTQIILYAEPQMNKMIKAKQALTCTELESQATDKKCKTTLAKRNTKPQTKSMLYREASKSVVAILISRKHLDHWHIVPAATGFFISDDGIIATNRHVFNKSDEFMFAMTSDYVVHPIKEVLGANAANDLAFCRIDSSEYKGLALRQNIPVGSDISLISHPSGRFYTYSHGVVTRRYVRPPQRGPSKTEESDGDQRNPVKVPTRWITISAEFGKGSSGGPVFDRLGNVVGMATSTNSLRVGKKTDTVSQMVFRDCVPTGVMMESLNPGSSNP
ncbi:MAG: serine protease [Rubripirellula sp.]|nr:serine protease [Rubripirellula sp.]